MRKNVHKLLTIEDLIAFCEQQNFQRFSSKDSGYQICVQIPAKFSQSDDKDEDMMFANVLAFHTGINRNHSNITVDAAKKAIKDMAYKPVLANFCEIDGVKDFTSHDFEIDEDGNFIYYEKQVGCFTADKPYIEQDPDNEDRMNVFAKVAIPRQYTDAAEIIERKGGTSCSVEIGVNELSWDSKEKTLLLQDITVMGLTCLGKNPDTGEDVQPGMENAHIQLEDFSVENNSLTFNSNIINEIADAIVSKISNAKTAERRNEPMDFEENIKEVTEETEVTEVMEETTEEETPVVETEASKEVVEEAVEETPEVVEENFEGEDSAEKPEDEEVVEEETEDDSEEVEDASEEFEEEETEEEEETVVDDDEQEPGYGKRAFSVDGVTFETSLSEIQWAVSELVNNTYSESDNDYYSVEVYESSKTVVMIGWCTGRAYKQSYKVRNGVYSLVGDRVNVKAVYVTADEEAELDKMRSNYSAISDKLAKYESEPEKMDILNSSDYANIADHADFAELKKQENHFDLTVDELKEKADAMLLAYAKSGKLNFAAVESQQEAEPKKDFFAFARFEQDTSFLDRVLKEKR